jgi:hypothetical protein
MKQKQHQKTRPHRQGFLVGSKEPKFLLIFLVFFLQYKISGPLASDAPGKLDVLGHYSHPLCMDRTQIGILKKTHKVGLGCFLECKNCMALEPKISLQTRNKRITSSVFKANAFKETLKHSPISFHLIWHKFLNAQIA